MKIRIVLSMAGLAGIVAAVFLSRAEAKPDAVSAASLTVGVSKITATTASIDYSKDKYDYGTRTLCYDPAPTTPKSNCVIKTASGNQGSFAVTGLKPGTPYNYSINAIDTKGGEKPYKTSGTFTTTGSTGINLPGYHSGQSPVPGLAVDASGRILPSRNGVRSFKAALPRR
jgi:hypothetical protein